MKYHIKYKGRIIASFVYIADRNICMEAFIDSFHDCEGGFKAEDDEDDEI